MTHQSPNQEASLEPDTIAEAKELGANAVELDFVAQLRSTQATNAS